MDTKKKAEIIKKKTDTSKVDFVLWVLIAALIVGGVSANYYFASAVLAIRFAIGIVLAVIVVFVAVRTAIGKKLLTFAKEARIELYKVVWPTRQETIHTTLIIAGLVVIMAFILWGIDSLLLWMINFVV